MRAYSWPILMHLGLAGVLGGCAIGSGSEGSADVAPLVASQGAVDVPGGTAAAPSSVRRSSTPLLEHAVTSFGATSLQGRLYVLGGYHGTPHRYDATGQTGAFRAFDPSTGAWTDLAPVEHLQSVELVVREGAPVRVAGMRAMNDPGTPADLRSLDEVERFDLSTNTWQALTPLPEPRSSHGCTVVDGKIYVVGGWHLPGGGATGHFERESFIGDGAGTWTKIAQPFSRRALGVGAVGHRVIAVGGIDEHGEPSKRVDILDTKTGEWTRGPDYPGDGFGVAVEGLEERLVASGMDGTVYVLTFDGGGDGDGARWSAVGRMAFPRFFHQLVGGVGDEGGVFAVGGIHGMTREDRIRVIEPVPTDDRGPEVLVWELEAPSRVKNRQAMFLRGDSLYLFGGNVSLGQHDFEAEHFSADGHRLHLTSMRWSEAAPLPTQRQSMPTVVDHSRGLSVGGFGHDGEVARTHPEAWAYDFERDVWTELDGGLPVSRTQFGMVEYDGAYWVFGGLDFDPRRGEKDMFRHLSPILSARPEGGALAFEPSGYELREPRRAFAGAKFGDRYYMVGGMKDGFEPVTQSEAFDFSSHAWVPIAAPSESRIGADLVEVDGFLYLVGGTTLSSDQGQGGSRKVERYDPERDVWTTVVDALPFEMRHARAMAYAGNLLIFSTHRDDGGATVAMIRLGRPRTP